MKANKGGMSQLVGVSNNILYLTAAATLRLDQRIIRASSSTVLGGAFAITLPPVGEAAGMIFTVYADSILNTATITVQDQNESVGWSDLALTATGDHICIYSDGLTWHVLHETTT